MLLESLEVENFRNLQGKMFCGKKLNVIFGENGQGKTNWLEAIYTLATTKSFKTARLQEARSIRAQGLKQAQIIRAQADADAAKTYAASFGKDPQFYDFYRAMQSYMTTFVGNGQDKPATTNIVLSPQNDYLKEFSGRSR